MDNATMTRLGGMARTITAHKALSRTLRKAAVDAQVALADALLEERDHPAVRILLLDARAITEAYVAVAQALSESLPEPRTVDATQQLGANMLVIYDDVQAARGYAAMHPTEDFYSDKLATAMEDVSEARRTLLSYQRISEQADRREAEVEALWASDPAAAEEQFSPFSEFERGVRNAREDNRR